MKNLIQPWWVRWMSTRWGFAYHTCHLWASRGKIGPLQILCEFHTEVAQSVDVVVVYREYITSDLSEPQLAQQIVDMTEKEERKRISRHYMTPPETFGVKGSRNTVVDQMYPILQEASMPRPERGDEDITGGWRLVYNCLKRGKVLAESESLTKEQTEEGPCLFISSECKSLIEAMPVFTRSQEDSERVEMRKMDAGAYDDTSDACGEALRILCKSMLTAKTEAPSAVRRRETWDSFLDPTDKALAILKFDAKEREKQYVRNKRWRG